MLQFQSIHKHTHATIVTQLNLNRIQQFGKFHSSFFSMCGLSGCSGISSDSSLVFSSFEGSSFSDSTSSSSCFSDGFVSSSNSTFRVGLLSESKIRKFHDNLMLFNFLLDSYLSHYQKKTLKVFAR